jgi:hypothetical protein
MGFLFFTMVPGKVIFVQFALTISHVILRAAPNATASGKEEHHKWTQMFGQVLEDLPELGRLDEALTNVILDKHGEVRDGLN